MNNSSHIHSATRIDRPIKIPSKQQTHYIPSANLTFGPNLASEREKKKRTQPNRRRNFFHGRFYGARDDAYIYTAVGARPSFNGRCVRALFYGLL